MSSWPATADERRTERDAERGRLAYAFGITSGVLIAQQDGTITKTATIFGSWPTLPNPNAVVLPAPFGADVDGSANTVSPYVGLNFEVMTPALEFIPSKPRFFAAAEFLPTFAPEVTVALDPPATVFTTLDQRSNSFSASSIGGQGSKLQSTVMTSVFAADAGIAFEFTFKERLLRLKPRAGWIRWGVVSTGEVLAAYKNDPVIPRTQDPFFGDNIRFVQVSGRGSGFFNAVGPGLELELELGKRGPFRPILYLDGNAYKTVGNDTITYQANVGVDDFLLAGTPGIFGDGAASAAYSATWNFQVAPWSYRAGLGVRLRWVGFD